MKRKFLPAVASVLFLPALALSSDVKGYDVEIILDVSGSMNSSIAGSRKIDVAKKAVGDVVQAMPKDTRLGFRAYGHQYSRDLNNCTDTELLFPVSMIDPEKIIGRLSSLTPNGYTPIEYSLRQAKNDFPANAEVGKMVILISDGKESCGGDPCKAVKELRDSGFGVTVNTVGFDVDSEAKAQLECIAKVSGGEYLDARNAQELTKSLEIFSARAKRTYTAAGEDVEPGTGFEDAKLISAGEYKGDILTGETHYYTFEVGKGQTLVAVANMRTLKEWGRTAVCKQRFRIELFDKYKRKILKEGRTIDPNPSSPATVSLETKELKPGTYYFAVHRSDSMIYAADKKACGGLPYGYELGLYLEGGELDTEE